MAFSRYARDSIIRNGRAFGTATSVNLIRQAVRSGNLAVEVRVFKQAERLDILAGQEYGDASLWWVIAAASDVGWGLQVPPGTRVVIPVNIDQVAELVV